MTSGKVSELIEYLQGLPEGAYYSIEAAGDYGYEGWGWLSFWNKDPSKWTKEHKHIEDFGND